MGRKKIVICGGGISGLTAAYLCSQNKSFDITLLEAKSQLGGWIQKKQLGSWGFNLGPRTIKPSVCSLGLFEKLGIFDELLTPSKDVENRFLLCKTVLHKLPTSIKDFFFSPLLKGFRKSILKGLFFSPSLKSDCSIEEYFSNRFSAEFCAQFINPFCLGIFGASPRALSFKTGLPALFERFSTSSFFKKQQAIPETFRPIVSKPMVSFAEGLSFLVHTLEKKISGKILKNQPIISVDPIKKRVLLKDGLVLNYDALYTTAGHEELFSSLFPHIPTTPKTSISTLHLHVINPESIPQGFGYLIPEKEREPFLGTLFDGHLFSNTKENFTISLLFSSENCDYLDENKIFKHLTSRLEVHLKTKLNVSNFFFSHALNAIPFFPVGFYDKREQWKQEIKIKFPSLFWGGSLFNGVGVNDNIEKAFIFYKEVSKQ